MQKTQDKFESIPSFTPLTIRGSGSFGYVIEAYDNDKGCRVAIKRTNKASKEVSREYKVLSKLRDCHNVVKMDRVFYSLNDKGQVIQNVIFEYFPQSLEGYISKMINERQLIPSIKIKVFNN
jgi:glycogen synthase kinase 3 beta